MISRRRLMLGFGGIVAFTRVCLGVWPPYTVTDLGTLGGDVSYAFGINDSEMIVGEGDDGQAVWFDGLEGLIPLGALMGHEYSRALDIQDFCSFPTNEAF